MKDNKTTSIKIGLAQCLNWEELTKLSELAFLSVKNAGRRKHSNGKTIRRRKTEHETEYGRALSTLKIIKEAMTIKRNIEKNLVDYIFLDTDIGIAKKFIKESFNSLYVKNKNFIAK